MFLLAIPFDRNFKVDQRNFKIGLKFMAVVVSIEMLLLFTLTNTRFGKIAYYNKESVNNTVQCPEEYYNVVTDFTDGRQIEGAH